MNIWLRAGLTRYLGRRLRFSRESDNSDLLGLAPFHPYIFDPAARYSKRWRRSIFTLHDGGAPRQKTQTRNHPSTIPPPRNRRDPQAWIPYLEPYISQSLGREAECISKSRTTERKQCHAIQNILYKSRAFSGVDLLSYLGVRLKRWEAVHAIMRRLLDSTEGVGSFPSRAQLPSNLDWGEIGSFEHITSDHIKDFGGISIKGGERTAALAAFDDYSEEPLMSGQLGEHTSRTGTMEEIWQILGSIVLDATDLPAEESRIAMSYVYRILAHLHHIDMIPNEVYKYSPANKCGALKRPPAIHILTWHIMNVLSDAVWQATETEMATAAIAKGLEVVPPRFKMRVRELGHGIWLDFILWCCVEGGFAKEGAWILERMKERSEEKVWSVKSWDSLQLAPEAVQASSVDRDHVWGESVKFPGKESPESGVFQGLGERTISSEVVSSLMDGLVNTLNVGVGHRGNSPLHVQDHIVPLWSILDRSGFPPPPGFFFSLLTRIFEAGGIIPESKPQALEHLLSLAPPVSFDEYFSKRSSSTDIELEPPPSMEEITNYSAMVLGMYRYILDIYSYVGNVGGAFDVFETLFAYVDAAKYQNTRQFSRELKQLVEISERKGTKGAHEQLPTLESNSTHFEQSSLPQLPHSSLALLLDISTSSKAYTFGEWLLRSTDADGPVIPLSLFGNKDLAPAIIRFAAATKNEDILNSVYSRLKVPLSNNVLKSLISYKMTVNDWDYVTRLLAHLRDTKGGHWGVTNVTSLAAAIIVLDKQPQTESQQTSLATAKHILILLLEGHYNRKRHPAAPSYSYQEEILYRLHRMLLTIPGALADAASKANVQWKPRGRETVRKVSAIAFRNLLAAVVENYGSAEGKRLWDLWCFDPVSPEARRMQGSGTSLLYFSDELTRIEGGTVPHFDKEWFKDQRSKAVIPDLRTIRIIAQGAVLENRKFQTEKESAGSTNDPNSDDNVTRQQQQQRVEEILEFCINTFRKFRLRNHEIDRELEGYLTEWKKKQRTQKRTPDDCSEELVPPVTELSQASSSNILR